MTIFGNIIDAGAIETAADTVLKKWMPTYLAEVERQAGRTPGDLPRIRSWTTRSLFDALPGEDTLPLIVIVSPGLAQQPEREARKYRARWTLGVAVVASARDQATTRRVVQLYAAAIRSVFVQRASLDGALGGAVQGIDWVDDRYDELGIRDDRTMAASRIFFTIEVHDVTSWGVGPVDPDPPDDPLNPYADWVLVETADITTEVQGG